MHRAIAQSDWARLPALFAGLQKARQELQKAVQLTHQFVENTLRGVTAASLRSQPGTCAKLLDMKLRSLGPAFRLALGEALFRASRDQSIRLRWGVRATTELHDKVGEARAAGVKLTQEEVAQELVQVLSLRVHPIDEAPTGKVFGAVFRDNSDDESSGSSDSDDDEHNGDVACRRLYAAGPGPKVSEDPTAATPRKRGEGLDWPTEWENEHAHVVHLDLHVDVAFRMNWRRFAHFFEVQGPCGTAAFRVAVLACALREPVRVWWHVERNQGARKPTNSATAPPAIGTLFARIQARPTFVTLAQ